MRVIETHEFNNSDHGEVSRVIVEVHTDSAGSDSVSIGEGEPEDMYLFRDLSDAYSISDLVSMAYQAGKNGEEFEYKLIEEKEE